MLVSKDNLKKLYEVTYLLPGDFSEVEVKKVKEEVLALIKKHKGEVKQENDWGKKTLAYKIKVVSKFYEQALFIYLEIELLPEKVSFLERDFNLNKNIMRHLLIANEQK
jgi:small subunit ribosomal protein S6